MHAPLAVLWRILAFVGKEVIETIRRPGAIVSLVLGPFLIMALFGVGYDGIRRPLETIVVAPASSDLPSDTATYQNLAGPAVHIVEVVTDRSAAEARLQAGTADVVFIAPDDPAGAFRAGKKSTIEVLIDEVDPVDENYATILAQSLVDGVNRQIIEQAVEVGQGYAPEVVEEEVSAIPPDVVAAPTEADVSNLAPSRPTVTAFFGPAVLALILQHLAVTLISLSLVRDRSSGVMELFRISPVSAAEIVAGKVLAFGLLGLMIAGITIALLVGGLGVPVLADPALVGAAIGMLLLASLGVGLLIAVVSDSERQVVQLAMLVLLGSVFFSGFVLSIDEFAPPVRALASTLPVTHGIRLLQDLMLRGTVVDMAPFALLAVIALVTLVAAWIPLRRSITNA